VPENPAKEACTDLLTHLEHLETLTGALLQLLKDNGMASDDKLAPYLEQASKASDVRMRAARARLEHLFTADDKARPATEAVAPPNQEERAKGAQPNEPTKGSPDQKETGKSAPQTKSTEQALASAPPAKQEPAKQARQQEKEPSEISAGREATKGHNSQENQPKKKDAA